MRRLQRWASECVGCGKLLLRCRLLSRERRFGANGGRGERRVHISWRHAHLQLVYINSVRGANRLWGEMSVRRKVHKTDRRTSRRRRRGAWRITGRRDGRNRLNTWPVCPAFSWRFVSYFHGLCVYINHERKRTLTYFSNTISNAMKRKVTNIK